MLVITITFTCLIVSKTAEKWPFVMQRTQPGGFEVLVGIEADGCCSWLLSEIVFDFK